MIMEEDHVVQSEDVELVIVDVTNAYRQVQYLARKEKECYSRWSSILYSYMYTLSLQKSYTFRVFYKQSLSNYPDTPITETTNSDSIDIPESVK